MKARSIEYGSDCHVLGSQSESHSVASPLDVADRPVAAMSSSEAIEVDCVLPMMITALEDLVGLAKREGRMLYPTQEAYKRWLMKEINALDPAFNFQPLLEGFRNEAIPNVYWNPEWSPKEVLDHELQYIKSLRAGRQDVDGPIGQVEWKRHDVNHVVTSGYRSDETCGKFKVLSPMQDDIPEKPSAVVYNGFLKRSLSLFDATEPAQQPTSKKFPGAHGHLLPAGARTRSSSPSLEECDPTGNVLKAEMYDDGPDADLAEREESEPESVESGTVGVRTTNKALLESIMDAASIMGVPYEYARGSGRSGLNPGVQKTLAQAMANPDAGQEPMGSMNSGRGSSTTSS